MTHFKVFSLDDAVSVFLFIYIFFKYTDNQ